jgi:CYTH domain-containing protein
MGIEIERKFLVASDEWRGDVVEVRDLRDGLIARLGGRKVRVRLTHGRASLAVKGPRENLARPEFEYEIPADDAEAILRMCDGLIIEKTRHCVRHAGHVWHVDVHHGVLAGLILAEIELRAPDEPFALPRWVGREVTEDPAFRKGALLQRAEKTSQ